jgi:prepilin-type N-terminal cleavage/methylation domain-containing protein
LKHRRGFTLIELLIVVAIIAILAAIAVPNFLEAQTRAKVSRVKSDMRTLVTAIEAYRIDHNVYPPNTTTAWSYPQLWNGQQLIGTLWTDISTPVAYITNSFLLDIFNKEGLATMTGDSHDDALFIYQNLAAQYCRDAASGPEFPNHQFFTDGDQFLAFYGDYRLGSLGPDMRFDIPGAPLPTAQTPYDATNGTISAGNIWRSPNVTDNQMPDPGVYPGVIGG